MAPAVTLQLYVAKGLTEVDYLPLPIADRVAFHTRIASGGPMIFGSRLSRQAKLRADSNACPLSSRIYPNP